MRATTQEDHSNMNPPDTDQERDGCAVLDLLKEKNVLYLSIGVAIFSIILASFISLLVSVVVLASYGAGLLVPYLIFREGKHLPNLLVIFLGSEGEIDCQQSRVGELRRSCSVCGGEQCSRQWPGPSPGGLASLSQQQQGPHHPHIHTTAPRCLDQAIEELLTLVLDEHVYSWYREFSVHDQLADEIRHVIRYAICVIYARLQQVDLCRVIVERLVPSLLCHLDQYVEGGRRVRAVGGVQAGVLEYTRRAGWMHPALHSRQAEADYLRSLVTSLKPYLLPTKYRTSSVADSFLRELLGRFLLLQAMDLLAEPDTVNLVLLLVLAPRDQQQLERQQQQTPTPHHQQLMDDIASVDAGCVVMDNATGGDGIKSGGGELDPVLLLKNFASVNTHPRNSLVRNNLSAVLKDQTLLYLFHTFLKEEQAIHILQFCLSVEDFNRRILDPELQSSAVPGVHAQALDLYHTYMAPGAPDRLPFPGSVVAQIRDMVHSEASAIIKLRTTRPLFQAYELAYNLLEREYLPAFMNSHMYFAHLCGSRSSQAYQKTSSRHRRSDSSSSATFSPFKSRLSKMQDDCGGSCSPRPRRGGLDGLTSGSYRDLSAWRVTIPRLDYVPDPATANSMTHFFVIDVTRIDVAGEGGEDTHWEVLRRFHEFYILESKLTEFHGEFHYNSLPSRRSLFTSTHASDFMVTRRQIFEEYLQKLLQTPALRKSQLLFLFLKSRDEFTSSFLPDVSLGRLLRDVPRKLVKERGQHLEPFIGLLMQGAQTPKSVDQLEEASEACEEVLAPPQLYPLISPTFGDNAASLPPPPPHVLPHLPPPVPFAGAGVTEMLLYVCVRVYGCTLSAVRWLVPLSAIFGATIDAAVSWILRRRLRQLVQPRLGVQLVHLIRDALLDGTTVTPSSSSLPLPSAGRARELALRAAVVGLLPGWLTRILMGEDTYREAANNTVNMVQHPTLNKQLSYVLLDQVLEELFPELGATAAAEAAAVGAQ